MKKIHSQCRIIKLKLNYTEYKSKSALIICDTYFLQLQSKIMNKLLSHKRYLLKTNHQISTLLWLIAVNGSNALAQHAEVFFVQKTRGCS